MSSSVGPRPDDIDRLPARHRVYVRNLEAHIRKLEAAQAAQQETRIIVEPYGARQYLPNGTTVRFMLGGDGLPDHDSAVDMSLRDSHSTTIGKGRSLNIRSQSPELVVLPSAGNACCITTRRLLERGLV